MVQGALSCSADADPIRRMLAARRNDGLRAMRRRFTHAVTEGDLPRDTDAADLARYLATVSHGLAVQAASGASRKELTRVAEMAMRAWPV
jgi:hypothetical protein